MKNEENSVLKILTYILIIIIIAFLAIFYMFFSQKKGFNINLSPQSENSSPAMPSQLKWHDSFQGIDNMKESKAPKEEKSKPANFLQYEIDKNKNK